MAKVKSLEELVTELILVVEELKQTVEENHEDVLARLNNIDVSGDGFSTYSVD